MPTTIKSQARRAFNKVFAHVGFELIRVGDTTGDGGAVRSFLPLGKTLKAAKQANLSVGDYVDNKYATPGASQETLEKMRDLGVFQEHIDRVCEIGPGTGRYLEKTLKACSPSFYEIYETATDWSEWLAQTYHVTARKSNGTSLADTPTGSIDLVHAHKVFPYLPFLVSCRYFNEMARVVRDQGKVVFDILSEDCFDKETLDRWIGSGLTYPCILPKAFVIDLMASSDLSFNASFFIPLSRGKTECLVFTKRSHVTPND